MAIRKIIKFGAYSVSTPLIILGIVFLINLIFSQFFIRFDFTKGKIFSLSKASKKILKKLDDIVIIKCYFSENLSQPYSTYKDYLKDLLKEYKIFSKGKIKYDFVHSSDEEKFRQEALTQGLPPLRFTQIAKDKYEVKEGFMGVVILFEDKKEVIPVVNKIESLEFDITSKIKKLITRQKKKIGYTLAHDEISLPQIQPYQMLSEQYDFVPVNLSEGTTTFLDTSAVLIIGPKNKFSERELFSLDQYIISGKPVAFFVDLKDVALETFFARPIETGLNDFLESYGIKIKQGIIFDSVCSRINLTSRQGFFMITNIVQYPAFPVITEYNKENPIVKDLGNIYLPYVSPIEFTKKSENTNFIPLTFSSKYAFYRENVFSLNPLQDFYPLKNDTTGQFVLSGILEGYLKSRYESPPANISQKEFIGQTQNARIIVIGTSKFLRDGYPQDENNYKFFQNIVDWLAEDPQLIAIRSKGINLGFLKPVSNNLRLISKGILIFFPPIFVLGFGIFRWQYRKIEKIKQARELLKRGE